MPQVRIRKRRTLVSCAGLAQRESYVGLIADAGHLKIGEVRRLHEAYAKRPGCAAVIQKNGRGSAQLVIVCQGFGLKAVAEKCRMLAVWADEMFGLRTIFHSRSSLMASPTAQQVFD